MICKKCNTANPINAKFCRKCGTAFNPIDRYKQIVILWLCKVPTIKKNAVTTAFTLDTFKSIDFRPTSIVEIRFVNWFTVFMCVLFLGLSFFSISYEGNYLLYEILYRNIDWYDSSFVQAFFFGVAAIFALLVLKSIYKKIRFKFNADYIESNFCGDEIVRIARKSRMGVFDKKKKKVLLPSKYSDVENFDDHHLMLSVGTKKGLYSLKYRRIIVPIKYESISKFVNSVTTVRFNGNDYHYDVKGNLLR